MHLGKVRRGEALLRVALRIEPLRKRGIVKSQGHAVGHTYGLGQNQVVGYRRLGDAQRLRDSPIGQITLVLEPQYFSNTSHGNPLGRHIGLLEQKGASVTAGSSNHHTTRPREGATFVGHLERRSETSRTPFPTDPPIRSTSSGNRVQHRRIVVHDLSEIPFNLRRNTQPYGQDCTESPI